MTIFLPSDPRYLVIDYETFGLNPQKCGLLEVSAVVCNSEFDELTPRYHSVMWPDLGYRDPQIMNERDWAFSNEAHKELIEEARASGKRVEEAEREIMSWLHHHEIEEKILRMAGNSVGSLERPFMNKHHPNLLAFLHYRMHDISTLREEMQDLTGVYDVGPVKKRPHRTDADITESIAELKFYRKWFLHGLSNLPFHARWKCRRCDHTFTVPRDKPPTRSTCNACGAEDGLREIIDYLPGELH